MTFKGYCSHGDHCNYAHSYAEIRKKPSKNGEDSKNGEEEPPIQSNLKNNIGDFISKSKKGQIIPKTTKPPIPEPSKITILKKSTKDSKPLEIANPWKTDRSGPAFNTRAKINEMVEEKSRDTGKSLSEALIFVSTNPQYDDRYFIELHVQYMKNSKLKPGENMLCTEKYF